MKWRSKNRPIIDSLSVMNQSQSGNVAHCLYFLLQQIMYMLISYCDEMITALDYSTQIFLTITIYTIYTVYLYYMLTNYFKLANEMILIL